MAETKPMTTADADAKAKSDKAAADKAAADKAAADANAKAGEPAAKSTGKAVKTSSPEETPAAPTPTQAEADEMKERARGQTREAAPEAESAQYKTR